MSFFSNKDLKNLVYPFSFGLKSSASSDDLMDFSLVILKLSSGETIPSPKGVKTPKEKIIFSQKDPFTPMAKTKKRQTQVKPIEAMIPTQFSN